MFHNPVFRLRCLLAVIVLHGTLLSQSAVAHPAPFSYLDLNLRDGHIQATLVVHALDFAYELGIDDSTQLLQHDRVEMERTNLFNLLRDRLTLRVDNRLVPFDAGQIAVLPSRQSVQLAMQYELDDEPGHLAVQALLFPYDPNHLTFLNVYERGELVAQRIFDPSRLEHEHFTGTNDGRWAVVGRFVPVGIHHIVIGPDHILFLLGLLLLGGSLSSLIMIVTAFTLAHSVTLSLAVLGVVTPPASVVEPAIALSIIYVGADNLLVSQEGRDLRAWIALAFGFIHGFGFAGVLADMDLPRQALGWTLASFNIGVELGQLVIVAFIATGLAAIRQRSAVTSHWITITGSVVVMLAGAYWFVERVFFTV